MVATPNLSLTVTLPDGTVRDKTANLAWSGTNQQMMITQNFGRQGDTAVITLMEEWDGTGGLPVIIPAMSQVSLYDHIAGQTLFAGIVTNPALCPRGPNLFEYDLNCTDYTFYADNAVVRWLASSVQAPDQIVVALTQQAACGISAATIADGGFVAPGPDLPDFGLGFTPLSSAWRTLASQMGQSVPYGWYVDEGRRLHFYNQSTAHGTGITFTDRPSKGGSTDQGHILLDSQYKYEWDATSLANRIMVQGATQKIITYTTNPYGGYTTVNSVTGPKNIYQPIGSPVDTWRSDGVQTSWPLRYTVSGTPVVYVGGVPVAVESQNTQGAAWTIVHNTARGYFLVAAAPPPAGTSIEAWYDYSVPIVMQANDTASQQAYSGPNGGIYTQFVNDSSLTTAAMALARAQAQRAEYAFPVERVTFNSSPDWLGWVRAGYTFTLDSVLIPDSRRGNAMGVYGEFLCIANQVTFGEGGYRTCQITAIRT